MRKFFGLTIVLLTVCCLIGSAVAYDRINADKNILIYTLVNSGANAANVTAVNATNLTSGIVPGYHRVIGYECAPYAAVGIPTVALFDAQYTGSNITYTSAGGLFAESAAPVAGGSVYREFPYPKPLTNGLTISASNATITTIFYERYSP